MGTKTYIGTLQNRVDGYAKVSGAAKFSAEHATSGLTHGVVVSSAIAKGRVTSIDTEAALAIPGVLQVFTHANRPRTAWFDFRHRDVVAPPGSPFRPLYDDRVVYSGQPIALVVAEDLGIARYAASLLRVSYQVDRHNTDLKLAQSESYEPPKRRFGMNAPHSRGDARAAFAQAPIKIESSYRIAIEHHNPMELHASMVIYEAGGKLTIYDKTQGVQNSQKYVAKVFGLASHNVRVVSPYVGGAFGSGLRPQYQLFLAVMAALELKRSVSVVLTRDQMFTFGYRPDTLQTVALGARSDGTLQAIIHEAVAGTSHYEDYQENTVNWSGLLYHCPNVRLSYRLARIDTATPSDMRAPGGATGVFAIETAMDELANATGLDPIELRLRNYAEKDENDGKPFSSKALRECYRQGAERFGWSRRDPRPRSMRESRELVGWGMATGVWEAGALPTSASAVLTADGKLEVACATADIGTGTYTILTQIAADVLGLPMESVTARIGDSDLPSSFVEGGSMGAASAGSAVQAACSNLREKLFQQARGMDGSPLANLSIDHVNFADARILLKSDPSRSVRLTEVVRAGALDRVAAEGKGGPGMVGFVLKMMVGGGSYSSYAHSAVFAEVKVDDELGIIRVTRIIGAVAAGKILNPKTARSQIMGGIVFGIGMALHEDSLLDHRFGRFMNRNIAEYHVPTHADVYDIEVIFVEEHDRATPMGIKGVGEIGTVGTAAAIGNAVYHATGVRVRELPITLDKIIAGG
ncbi:MAG TPA: xanthine dehydrogenase family protein molybdopterin-binding subunit [Hyphomicrobiaceae bacterium]|nr:xanthine dehydrogenase family protein molybdopterin-binding subunit [Hyphomicrobiaceae bacterium]